MEEILKKLLFAPLQTETHFLFERTAGVQHLYVLLTLAATRNVIFRWEKSCGGGVYERTHNIVPNMSRNGVCVMTAPFGPTSGW